MKTPRNKTCLTIKELVLNLTHVAPKWSNIALSYNKNKLKDKMSVICYKGQTCLISRGFVVEEIR
jgi:hypothetical protein